MSTFDTNQQSWGQYPRVHGQTSLWPNSSGEVSSYLADSTTYEVDGTERLLLPRGLGRSYGDSCLNENGALVQSRNLDHFLEFSATTGILKCESGVSFAEILDFAVPRGYFVPVTPGTAVLLGIRSHAKSAHRRANLATHYPVS